MNSSPALSPLTFVRSIAASPANRIPFTYQYSYARGALITAIQSIKDAKGLSNYPRVWAPSFVCDTVFFLLDHYQIEYRFYPLDDNLLPDWPNLKHLNFHENDIFLLVYFFGFPMGIPETLAFCRDKKIFLIEDCAHSVIDKVVPGGIGTHGIGAIFGLRKIIPTPDGGFLYMKDIPISIPPNVSTSPGIYRSPLKMMAQWLLAKFNINLPASRDLLDKSTYQLFEENYSLFNFQAPLSYWGRKSRRRVH